MSPKSHRCDAGARSSPGNVTYYQQVSEWSASCHFGDGMSTRIGYFVIALQLLAPLRAHGQGIDPPDGTRIASAQLSGLELSKLSPGLREEIGKLAGNPLDRQKLTGLAERIEAEHPRYVTAVRVTGDPDGSARVVFVAARMRDAEHQANINARYIVEKVQIRGVPDRAVTAEMRDDLQALTGKTLDSDLAERLEARLKSAFTDYNVQRRTSRGSQPGQIKVVFQLTRTEQSRWLRFEPLEANTLYHSDQGWGAKLPLTMSGGDFQVVPHFAIDVGDDLIEEYSGVGLRFESRRLVSERLGVFFEWSTFDQDWREQTLNELQASSGVPGPYRNRMTVTPLAKFAITPRLTLSGGVSIVELDALDESSSASQMANAAIGGLRFNQRWHQTSGVRHDLEAAFTLRAGTDALESDLVYERYLGQADYAVRWAKHRLFVSSQFGGIAGEAPLFERFSLGDSRTLRGWDKYDIAPAGGDRVVHASVDYRYRVFALFFDSGSVWNTGSDRKVRFSTGFGVTTGPVFMMVGFPINTEEFRAVFIVGFRLSTAAVGIRKN